MADEHPAAFAASDAGQTQSAEMCRSCFPPLSHDVAPQEWCTEGPGTLLDGARGRGGRRHLRKLKEDVKFRQEVTNRIGLGFELVVQKPFVGLNGRKVELEAVPEVAVTV